MSLLLDYLIIDGFSYDWLPLNFTPLTTPEYGVRSSRPPTLDLGAQIVTNTEADTEDAPYASIRKIKRQAWAVEFDIIDQCMFDHIKVLYDTQKFFFIQFDDEMSRDDAPLIRSGSSGKTFFTPTYPIQPYGYYPGAVVSYAGTIKVYDGTNAISIYSGATITPSTGMIEFANPLIEDVVVAMSYTWRCYVRIAGFDLRPRNDIPQGMYGGSIIIEQVSTFHSNDPWVSLAPCFIQYNSDTVAFSPVSDIPSYIQDNSLPGSSGYVTPPPSGTTTGSVPPTIDPNTILATSFDSTIEISE